MKITEKIEEKIIEEVFNEVSGKFFPGQRNDLKNALHSIFIHLRNEE
jgi:hypothetical protein